MCFLKLECSCKRFFFCSGFVFFFFRSLVWEAYLHQVWCTCRQTNWRNEFRFCELKWCLGCRLAVLVRAGDMLLIFPASAKQSQTATGRPTPHHPTVGAPRAVTKLQEKLVSKGCDPVLFGGFEVLKGLLGLWGKQVLWPNPRVALSVARPSVLPI